MIAGRWGRGVCVQVIAAPALRCLTTAGVRTVALQLCNASTQAPASRPPFACGPGREKASSYLRPAPAPGPTRSSRRNDLMERLTWSAPSSCSACPASLTISSLDLSPRSLRSRAVQWQWSERSEAKWRGGLRCVQRERGSSAVRRLR